MRKTVYHSILFWVMLLFTCSGFTQQRIFKIANKMFEQRKYINAQEAYLKLIDRDFRNAVVLKNLGDSYYFTGQLEDAGKWLKELVESYPNEFDPEYLFKYAQSLKSVKNYSASDHYMNELLKIKPEDQRANLFNTQRDYLQRIEYQSDRYNIANISINSRFTDFGATFYQDGIVFSSSRDTLLFQKRVHKWTEESFLELYVSSYDNETDSFSNPKPFSRVLGERFHESSPAFTNDRNTIYFTQNQKDVNEKTVRLKILRSYKKEDNTWSLPEDLPFNDENYSTSHPAISSDGKTLYFSSDMPGGYGMSDIYAVSIFDDGNFGAPLNLGGEINTEARETFPYSIQDELYFSSNGHPGLGGLDIFRVKLDSTVDLEVINVGKPVNGNKDDFAYIINEEGSGFFSSNREGGQGGDDIYSLVELYPIRSFDLTTILGDIKNQDDFQAVNEATIRVFDSKNNLIETNSSVADGSYRFYSERKFKDAYRIEITKEGYKPYDHIIDKQKFSEVYEKSIELEKEDQEPLAELLDDEPLAESEDAFNFELVVHPDHFENNSNTIRSNSLQKLDEIVALLEQYPRVNVNIKYFTIEDDEYTSHQARLQAQVIKQYLLDHNVASERLSARGYPRNRVKNEERLGLIMVVPTPIYFQFNSEEIRPGAETGLSKVVDLMTIYPGMKMQIHAHADSRSSFWYNKKLSVRRLRATEYYLTKTGGIYWSRFQGRAYGERRPYNNCRDGIPCTEEQHQENRRSEFLILE